MVQYVVIFSYFTRLSSSSASIVSTNCRWELLAEGERMCNRKKNSDESGNRLMKIKQFCIPPRLWAHKKLNEIILISFIVSASSSTHQLVEFIYWNRVVCFRRRTHLKQIPTVLAESYKMCSLFFFLRCTAATKCAVNLITRQVRQKTGIKKEFIWHATRRKSNWIE